MTDGCTGSKKNYENRWEREECAPEETLYIEQMEKPEAMTNAITALVQICMSYVS